MVKINKNKNENENKHKYNFFVVYIVFFSLSFAINIGIGVYFICNKYVNCNKYNLPYQAYEMGQDKQLNIKNQTYYFFDDVIDIRNFHSNLLKIDKKPYKDINTYYIGYITNKKFGDCEHIPSVNPLYLIIHSATGYFREKKR